jgi:hypothetical protein
MKGNFHVRFLGEEAAVMPVSLPDPEGELSERSMP